MRLLLAMMATSLLAAAGCQIGPSCQGCAAASSHSAGQPGMPPLFAGDVVRALQGDWSAFEEPAAPSDAIAYAKPKRGRKQLQKPSQNHSKHGTRNHVVLARHERFEPIDLDHVPPAPLPAETTSSTHEATPAHATPAQYCETGHGPDSYSHHADEGPCYFLGPEPTPKSRFAPVPVRPVFSPSIPPVVQAPMSGY